MLSAKPQIGCCVDGTFKRGGQANPTEEVPSLPVLGSARRNAERTVLQRRTLTAAVLQRRMRTAAMQNAQCGPGESPNPHCVSSVSAQMSMSFSRRLSDQAHCHCPQPALAWSFFARWNCSCGLASDGLPLPPMERQV